MATLTSRVARYESIIAMRGPATAPTMTYEAIGATFNPPLTAERVRQIIAAGKPQPNGRPKSPARRAELRRKLGVWQRRRAGHIAAGRDTTVADRRIAALSAELAAYD